MQYVIFNGSEQSLKNSVLAQMNFYNLWYMAFIINNNFCNCIQIREDTRWILIFIFDLFSAPGGSL